MLQTGDNSKIKLKYLGGKQSASDLKNKRAVPCDLNMSAVSDCYFGSGIYSDGLCEEDLGTIIPSRNRVLMPSHEGRKPATCGVYLAVLYS